MNILPFIIIISMSLNFMFFLLYYLAGKEWWYYFKRVRFRKKGYSRIIKIDKTGVVNDDFLKVDDEVKFNEDKEIIGTQLGKARHWDGIFGMPVRFVVNGNMTDSDLRELFNRNTILKRLLDKNPELKKELDKIIINRKGKGKTKLIDFVYNANLNDEYTPSKHQDFLNSVGIRLFNLGASRGLNALKSIGNMKWMWLGLVIIGILLIIVLFLLNKNAGAIDAVNASISSLKAGGSAVIGK